MAHLPSKVATPPKRLAATSPIAQRFSKALSFANSQAAKTEKVQAALTAARNGDGLFGIKK